MGRQWAGVRGCAGEYALELLLKVPLQGAALGALEGAVEQLWADLRCACDGACDGNQLTDDVGLELADAAEW